MCRQFRSPYAYSRLLEFNAFLLISSYQFYMDEKIILTATVSQVSKFLDALREIIFNNASQLYISKNDTNTASGI